MVCERRPRLRLLRWLRSILLMAQPPLLRKEGNTFGRIPSQLLPGKTGAHRAPLQFGYAFKGLPHYTCARLALRRSKLPGSALLLVLGTAFAAQQPPEPAAVLNTYCITCHGDRTRSGGLSLEGADLGDIPKGAETWEKVIRKVRAGMMPPPTARRPPAEQLAGLAGYLETSLDRAAAVRPRPGRTAMH